MHVIGVMANNGLGHFRRTVRLLSATRERLPTLTVGLVCERWQLDRLRSWPPLAKLLESGAETHTGLLTDSVAWSSDPSLYNDERLFAWQRRVEAVPGIRETSLVLSDNLVGTLAVRPDTVLVGSFLWSDVLEAAYPDHPSIRRFAAQDRELLARHRPDMLCIADIAMPGVLERTQAHPLPWMCEWALPADESPPATKRIALLGGATGAAQAVLLRAGRALHDQGWELAADLALATALGDQGVNVRTFDHSPAAYASCSVALCRPGTGTLTDCVASLTPMLMLRETNNPELSHNAARMAGLDYGHDLGEEPSARACLSGAKIATDPQVQQRMRLALRAAKRAGIAAAVDFLTARLRSAACQQGDPS
jgi:hypothetical protein